MSRKQNDFPPMRFALEEKVRFTFNGNELVGIVEVADFGGSFENDFHSYDIYVIEVNCLYKHIPERDCKGFI